jgi:hypothetical protein
MRKQRRYGPWLLVCLPAGLVLYTFRRSGSVVLCALPANPPFFMFSCSQCFLSFVNPPPLHAVPFLFFVFSYSYVFFSHPLYAYYLPSCLVWFIIFLSAFSSLHIPTIFFFSSIFLHFSPFPFPLLFSSIFFLCPFSRPFFLFFLYPLFNYIFFFFRSLVFILSPSLCIFLVPLSFISYFLLYFYTFLFSVFYVLILLYL